MKRLYRVPTIYVLSRNKKNIRKLSEKCSFFVVKFSVYLNRLVFVLVNNKDQDLRKKPHNLKLRKHAYPNILKISPPKTGSFQTKNTDIFHISAQNIDCGYLLEPPHQGASNEYPQSMFLSRNKKKIFYTPLNPSFTI